MSLPAIRVVDVQNGNKVIDLSELTEIGLGSLIFEAKLLLDDLEYARRKELDNETD